MPRTKGIDQAVQKRLRDWETVSLFLAAILEDTRLLSLLTEQEIRTQDRPSERLMNMKETTERIEGNAKVIKDVIEQ